MSVWTNVYVVGVLSGLVSTGLWVIGGLTWAWTYHRLLTIRAIQLVGRSGIGYRSARELFELLHMDVDPSTGHIRRTMTQAEYDALINSHVDES